MYNWVEKPNGTYTGRVASNRENKQILYPILNVEKTFPHISACFGIKKKSLKKLDELFDENYETYLEDFESVEESEESTKGTEKK